MWKLRARRALLALAGIICLTDAAKLRCYRNSINDYDVVPLSEASSLLDSTCYNSSRSNLVYTSGYMITADHESTQRVLEAALNNVDSNLFLLDWGQEASAVQGLGVFGLSLSYALTAAPNTAVVGKEFGSALVAMSAAGFALPATRLVGHSLGAHVMGETGRTVILHNKIIPQITGLDPAGPLFDSVLPTLDRSCAAHVVSVHTDPGGYGLNSSISSAEIWLNFGNFIVGPPENQTQPDCPHGTFELLSDIDLCSHVRAWEYLISAWEHPESLLASRASNYYEWASGRGNQSDVICLEHVPMSARGNYYLTTRGSAPYGKYEEGLSPSP